MFLLFFIIYYYFIIVIVIRIRLISVHNHEKSPRLLASFAKQMVPDSSKPKQVIREYLNTLFIYLLNYEFSQVFK